MSGETQLLMEQLVDAVKRTQEYNQYQTLLENVRKRPEIYQRIGEFRRRSIAFQMTEQSASEGICRSAGQRSCQ